MKLSDVMSAANLAFYAEVGLLVFLGVFLVVAAQVLLSGREEEWKRLGRIPLDVEGSDSQGEEDRS